jgi:hypothetical protein
MSRLNKPPVTFRAFLALCLFLTGISIHASTFTVSSTAAFLRTSQDLSASDALPINLASLNIKAGDPILVEQLGAFGFCLPCDDAAHSMIGVFSSTAVLLPSDQLGRVPGAVAAGLAPFLSSETYYAGLSTDIPQDFQISNLDGSLSSLRVVVPKGARFLFVGAPDVFYGDNIDPNGDYAVSITTVGSTVPEPATILLFGTGLAGIGGVIRRRRQGKEK